MKRVRINDNTDYEYWYLEWSVMILFSLQCKIYPTSKKLVAEHVASRIANHDFSLYSFDQYAEKTASEFMGWTSLASNPPTSVKEISKFASKVHSAGYDEVILIGEGGSTQAPMTITKYARDEISAKFKVIDSLSPVRIRSTMHCIDPSRALVIVSSKSGTTLETISNATVVWNIMSKTLGDKTRKHYIAITDPDTPLDRKAREEGWLKVFNGEKNVGGRFSALSVFGLVPAALAGVNIKKFVRTAREYERICNDDAIDNPAVMLAAFMYDNYLNNRDKFCFLSPKRGRVLGLWIEQLIAESLGKDGNGIVPCIDPDPLDLTSEEAYDRTAVICRTKTDLWDERKNFETGLSLIKDDVPTLSFNIDTVNDLASAFIVWERATAMLGYLMKVDPFNQPDVTSAKEAACALLSDSNGEHEHNYERTTKTLSGCKIGDIGIDISESIKMSIEELCDAAHIELSPVSEQLTVGDAVTDLLVSMEPGDYIAINAFIPFTGEWRRESLDSIRRSFAEKIGCVSCLEIGPRYLHSTGQLQKGGHDNGVFLIISSNESKDIDVRNEENGVCRNTLSRIAECKAIADWSILNERGRRAVHIHLPDNSGTTLRMLAREIDDAVTRSTRCRYAK